MWRDYAEARHSFEYERDRCYGLIQVTKVIGANCEDISNRFFLDRSNVLELAQWSEEKIL